MKLSCWRGFSIFHDTKWQPYRHPAKRSHYRLKDKLLPITMRKFRYLTQCTTHFRIRAAIIKSQLVKETVSHSCSHCALTASHTKLNSGNSDSLHRYLPCGVRQAREWRLHMTHRERYLTIDICRLTPLETFERMIQLSTLMRTLSGSTCSSVSIRESLGHV